MSTTVTLTLNIATGKKVGIKSFSFYNRVSNSGYRHWKMFINGIEVGDSTLYYPATGGTGNNTVKTTGTVPVKNAVEDLTGTITVLLKLYDHDAAYPNGNAQGTFRMDDFILNGYVNDDGGTTANGNQYAHKGGYRYGFNGKEKLDEIKGEANSLDFGARIYDPRLGRWLSSDPAYTEYPSYSPYNFALDNPIINLDNDGKRVYYCPGLGGRGANPDGAMSTTGGSKYVQSVADAFTGSGVYFKELQGVNGQAGNNNIGKGNNPRLTDALFVAKYGQKPVQSLYTDHRIANAVTQIVQDATQHPLNPGEKVNLIGTSMGAVTTAQSALYILEHKKELGLPDDFRIDNVILAGSTVNTKSRLYKRLEKALQNQEGGAGRLLSGTVDENGENGYNYPEDQDGVTGLAGRTKFGMVGRFFRLIKQVVRIGQNGKLISVNENHPHLKAADDPNFGKGLIKQALEKDKIEGDKGAEGAKEYLKLNGG